MPTLCTLKHIHLNFGTKVLFEDATLSIDQNDRLGLLGLNGSGKSSLLGILSSGLEPDASSPPFEFDQSKGQNGQLPFTVFYVKQDLANKTDPSYTIKKVFYDFYPKLAQIHQRLDVINHEMEQADADLDALIKEQSDLLEHFEHQKGWEIISSFQSYLKLFDLNDWEVPIIHLSGGNQKKILLSLGFSSVCHLILWDEPTNHLDLESIRLFEELLDQSEKAFVLISHDRYLLSKVTNRICYIENGQISSFDGSYANYLEHLQFKEEERVALLAKLKNSLSRETAWMRQGIKARGTRSKKRVENFQDLTAKVRDIKTKERKLLSLSLENSQRRTQKLVACQNMSFGFENRPLFEKVTLDLWKNQKIGLLGPNGAGKSTLLALLTGQLTPNTGSITRAEGLKVRMFSQKREDLKLDQTPFEYLGDGNDFVILASGAQRHIAAYFESFLFQRNQLHQKISSLSGGEQNRLTLAKNLLSDGDIWIFDEPTNDLDLETLEILEKALCDYKGALILVSHDRAFLSAVTDSIWFLHQKTLEVFHGGYTQAEAYMEALALEEELEKEMKKNEPISSAPVADQTGTAKKPSFKDQQEQKDREKKIKQLEKKLETIETKLSAFDFDQMGRSVALEYQKLSEEKEALEEEILSLMD